jgi:hypothetical protein
MKTSTTTATFELPSDLLEAIARFTGPGFRPSDLVAAALKAFLARQIDEKAADERDRKLLELHAKQLNEEALDALEFQDGLLDK